MQNKKLIAFLMAVCGIGAAFGGSITGQELGTEKDLSEANDYKYYVANPDVGRANHYLIESGTYNLNADKVWSSIRLKTTEASPAVLNLGGHTLTLTGCDSDVRPLYLENDRTLVISNGTVKTVYDTERYSWTIESASEYEYRRFAQLTGDRTTLIVENGGTLEIEDGTSNGYVMKGSHNRFRLQDGATYKGLYYPDGIGTSFNTFSIGDATWENALNYKDAGGSFPVNIWYGNTAISNTIEITSSEFLSRYEIKSLCPGSHPKDSYHCGLVLRGTAVDFTESLQQDVGVGSGPVRLEVRDGAKLRITGELHVVSTAKASGSEVTVDGEGSLLEVTGWGTRVGSEVSCAKGLLRVSNGAFFDASAGKSGEGGSINVGYPEAAGADGNVVEVSTGSHVAAGRINVGSGLNYNNKMMVDGEGTTVTNLNGGIGIGCVSSGDGGGHSVSVTRGAEWVTASIDISEHGRGNELIVDGGRMIVSSGIKVGNSSIQEATRSNRIVVCNGGYLKSGHIVSQCSHDLEIVISNGVFEANQFFLSKNEISYGTNATITIAGTNSQMIATDWSFNLQKNSTLNIVVPRNGFKKVPISVLSDDGYQLTTDETTTINIDASQFVQSDLNVTETPLFYSKSGFIESYNFQDVLDRVKCGANWYLEMSEDRHWVYLKRRSGQLFLTY